MAYSVVAVGLVLGGVCVVDSDMYPKFDSCWVVSVGEGGRGLGTAGAPVGPVADERELLPALERADIQGTWFLVEVVEAESG